MPISNAEILSYPYRGCRFHLMMSDFQGAFAYWVVKQHENPLDILDINEPINAFTNYLRVNYFPDKMNSQQLLTYDEVNEIVSEKTFMTIPEIMKLNQIDSWLDLGALARNVFCMVLRECVEEGFYEK